MITFETGNGISAQWFDRWSDWVFDQVEVTSDEAGLFLRAEMKRRILKSMRGERDPARDGQTITMFRQRFEREVEEAMRCRRFEPPRFGFLRRVWDFAHSISAGYASWKSRQSEVSFLRAPALELTPADEGDVGKWRERWLEAGGNLTEGRMIAARNDLIWSALASHGLPWPPFDEDSFVSLASLRRQDLEKLGIRIPPQTPLKGCWWDGVDHTTEATP